MCSLKDAYEMNRTKAGDAQPCPPVYYYNTEGSENNAQHFYKYFNLYSEDN